MPYAARNSKNERPLCQACGKVLPKGSRSTRKYCSDTCRYHKWLARKDRVTIPSNLRFSILRRDGFRCRYCGAGPTLGPDGAPRNSTLRVDHVVPVNEGGDLTNEANLVTACDDCNQGKGKTRLSPDEVPPPSVLT